MPRVISIKAALAAAGIVGAMLATPAAAEFPEKGMTLIVAYGAGGGTDTTARMLASDLEETIGQPVTVQNVTGGGGGNGWGAIAAAEPDGYTIGYINIPNMYSGYLNPDMGREESLESFTPLMNHVTDYCVWAVKPDSPFQSVNDVVEAAKEGRVTITAHGAGGDDDLAIQRIAKMNDLDMAVVHNQSTADSKSQVLGGHVQVLGANVSEVADQHASGELRVIGVMAPERSGFLPDVPTFQEQGIDQVWSVSRGIAGPTGRPPEIAEAIMTALEATITSDAHRQAAEQLSLAPEIVKGPEYMDFLKSTEQEIKGLMGW
ncbi:Bug family tripartite tricarboxylate transporter substrate binding protein [Rhodosalinus sp. FB01]|uniref:Bug family tripartite tricarboxylate transporter substrate binding protein n=1 Tax=Rhodosalinus sp. FB01 TaxID=3239194 RepID=UPI0035265F24